MNSFTTLLHALNFTESMLTKVEVTEESTLRASLHTNMKPCLYNKRRAKNHPVRSENGGIEKSQRIIAQSNNKPSSIRRILCMKEEPKCVISFFRVSLELGSKCELNVIL